MKKGKEKERLEKSGEDEEGSFVEAFVTKNKGRFVEEEENPAEDDGKDSTKRTGVVGVFENKELKRKGPCGSAALTALLSKNDGGSGLHAGTWDDDDGDDDDDERGEEEEEEEEKESKTSKKKDLREMTPEERKKHLRLQRKPPILTFVHLRYGTTLNACDIRLILVPTTREGLPQRSVALPSWSTTTRTTRFSFAAKVLAASANASGGGVELDPRTPIARHPPRTRDRRRAIHPSLPDTHSRSRR